MLDCAEKLKKLREARGMTQAQVGARIGISKTMVSAYETASKTPSVEVLVRLARLYGASVDYLVSLDAPKTLNVSTLDDETVARLAAFIEKI